MTDNRTEQEKRDDANGTPRAGESEEQRIARLAREKAAREAA